MDKKNPLIKKLRNFKEDVSKDVPIKKMIFFGSRARGEAHRYSDIDLLLVSEKFRKKKFRKRPLELYKYWHLNYPVDFLCYTPEEFSKLEKRVTIVREAVKEGVEV